MELATVPACHPLQRQEDVLQWGLWSTEGLSFAAKRDVGARFVGLTCIQDPNPVFGVDPLGAGLTDMCHEPGRSRSRTQGAPAKNASDNGK